MSSIVTQFASFCFTNPFLPFPHPAPFVPSRDFVLEATPVLHPQIHLRLPSMQGTEAFHECMTEKHSRDTRKRVPLSEGCPGRRLRK